MSTKLMELHAAGAAVKTAEVRLTDAERDYQNVLKIDGPATERRAKYDSIVSARQRLAEARKALQEMEAAAGVRMSEPLDVFEAADRLAERVFLAEAEQVVSGQYLNTVRRTLCGEETGFTLSKRAEAYAALSRLSPANDALFFAFVQAVDRAAQFFTGEADKRLEYPLSKRITDLQDSLQHAESRDEPRLAGQIKAELAEVLEQRERILTDMIAQLLAEWHGPEMAKLYAEDRAEFSRRKTLGEKLLFSGR